MEEAFVIKVQKPVGGLLPFSEYLIYPEDGAWDLMWPIGDQPLLDEAMLHSVKRYFWARMDDNGRLEILTQLPCDQSQLW
jgi:hypothetical protein